jgi:hypothetical protein
MVVGGRQTYWRMSRRMVVPFGRSKEGVLGDICCCRVMSSYYLLMKMKKISKWTRGWTAVGGSEKVYKYISLSIKK